MIAHSVRSKLVLETSHPPVYYLPQTDVEMSYLTPTERATFCEFKGSARYWSLRVGNEESLDAAWSYPDPTRGFEAIRDHFAFYPSRVGACYLGEERVAAQAGDFYGGWITSDIVGPFKGGPGTSGW